MAPAMFNHPPITLPVYHREKHERTRPACHCIICIIASLRRPSPPAFPLLEPCTLRDLHGFGTLAPMSGIERNQEARDIGRLALDLRNRLWELNDDKTVLKECRSYFDSAGDRLRVIDNSLALSLYDLRVILEEFTTGE